MKINYLLIIVLFLSSTVAKSQHFSFIPDRLHEENVSSSSYSNHIIYMENLTGGELVLEWERLSMDMPVEWQADLCDYVGCYMGVPEAGIMMPITDTVKGYLKVTINPNDTPGSGTFVFKVFDNKHPEVVDTCTFIVHASEMTSVGVLPVQEKLKAYPNPAHDYIYVKGEHVQTATLKLIDMQGAIHREHKTNENTDSKINIQGIPPGIYILMLSTDMETIEREIIIIQ